MNVGFIGWRGMVGSVLMARMRTENDFDGLTPTFYSTSNPGGRGPDVGDGSQPLRDAKDIQALSQQDVLVSCQGGAYTEQVYPALRKEGWNGYWIDAASALRMTDEATLVLDPVNGATIRSKLAQGARTFVGANCTVSLMLMGLHGLINSGHVSWISSMTYQAASGAGARNLTELVAQMRSIGNAAGEALDNPATAALAIDSIVANALTTPDFPVTEFGAPLAANALPWIDKLVDAGQTREEWKGMAEANKLLDRSGEPLPIDGLCVRIGAMRCHAQALTIKLDRDIPLDEIEGMLNEAHPWSKVVSNTQEATVNSLTPAALAGSLQVPVGRLRKMKMGPQFVAAFTVGDQLLWGAAEPLRRMLNIIREATA